MSRIAVIGDIGGHTALLRRALEALGAGSDGDALRLPADLTVVQVGDLIHRGPDSRGALALADTVMWRQPGQWIQLAGNHEAQYLTVPAFLWPETLDPADSRLLRRWWDTGRLRVATAISAPDHGELLVTHAGLTVGLWHELGRPGTATAAAEALCGLPRTAGSPLWRPGRMLSDHRTDPAAGPLWAAAAEELYEPWRRYAAAGGQVPFGQVHGHSTPYHYGSGRWYSTAPVIEQVQVDAAARHIRVTIGGRLFTGIDPGFGRHGAARWSPLVLEGATVTA